MSQVCVAPDYVICNERVRDDVVRLAKDAYREFFGNNAQASHDLGRMVNERNFDRVKGMLDKTKGRVVIGGEKMDRDLKYLMNLIIGARVLNRKCKLLFPLLKCRHLMGRSNKPWLRQG